MSGNSNESSADSFKNSAEKTVNTARQAAGIAKRAVKAGKSAAVAAGAASGAATMGVGTAVTLAIEHKDTLAKAAVTIAFFFFIIIASIASLPNLIFGSGDWAAKDVTDKNATIKNTDSLVDAVKKVITDKHSEILNQINNKINKEKSSQPASSTSSTTPKITYAVSDNYKEVTNDTIYLAMSSYCIAIRDGKVFQSYSDSGDNVTVGGMTNLEQFIALHEGFSSTAYRGVDYQNWTIGYGHVIVSGDGLSASSVITEAQALHLMRKDLTSFFESVDNEFSGCNLKSYQRDALVDFSYNEGTNWSKWPNLVNIIKNHGSPEQLKDALLKFTTSDGQSVLTKRRLEEWNMYCNGVYAYGSQLIDNWSDSSSSSEPVTSSEPTVTSGTSTNEAADPDQFKGLVTQYANEFMTCKKSKCGNTVTYTTYCDSSAVFNAFNLAGDEQIEAEQMSKNLQDYLLSSSDSSK